MKTLLISLTALFLVTAYSSSEAAPALYTNSGNNTAGFILRYGDLHFTVDNNALLGSSGGGWFALPVFVSGNFQIDFDVYGDSGDVDSYLLLLDEATNRGLNVRNCPQDTDDSSIAIQLVDKLKDHDEFYFPRHPLAFAKATHFPNHAWTHVTIVKKGLTLTDNVGGQVITADLSKAHLPPVLRVGLGYYSTTNLGGNGEIGYANLRIVQTPSNFR